MTVQQFLDFVSPSQQRTELHDGEVYVIEDASPYHGLIIVNLGTALHNRLTETGCHLFTGVHVGPIDGSDIVNPDITVVCGAFSNQRRPIANPTLVIEVLSPSTQDYDYGGKFALYRMMSSLREYVLVSQDRAEVEVFRKDTASGRWILTTYTGLDAAVPLETLKISVPMNEIYRGAKDLLPPRPQIV